MLAGSGWFLANCKIGCCCVTAAGPGLVLRLNWISVDYNCVRAGLDLMHSAWYWP